MNRLMKVFGLSALFAALLLLVSSVSFTTSPVAAQGPDKTDLFKFRQVASPKGEEYGPRSCDENAFNCTEPKIHKSNATGYYIGHDEPSLLFYDNRPGSGNSNLYQLRLPVDPPEKPKQDGSGGTWNFQLHPAFWFGMALCDSQSYPNFTHDCTPNSDSNIFTDTDPNSPKFIGKHPGAAFLEMQFYAPGWAPFPPGASCDATKWCASLHINSFIADVHGNFNNLACESIVGDEPTMFAFITKNRIADQPGDAVTLATNPPVPNPATDFFMNSGDLLRIDIHDSAAGLVTRIDDLTTHTSGFMTASIANGFAQIKFDPNGNGCTNIPYAFHPMYATSSEDTFVPWAVHTYNVAYSDEIGHFEYCTNVAEPGGDCLDGGGGSSDGDADDTYCFPASFSLRIKIGGCQQTDGDFDGPEYNNTWPGTFTNVNKDQKFHSSPILFTSPLFHPAGTPDNAGGKNYKRLAFEADLPAIESYCPPFDDTGCTNPPLGSTFYPIYTTGNYNGACWWQEGGPYIPGTTNTFGGSSATEYGTKVLFTPFYFFDFLYVFTSDYRHILNNNPCPQAGAS